MCASSIAVFVTESSFYVLPCIWPGHIHVDIEFLMSVFHQSNIYMILFLKKLMGLYLKRITGYKKKQAEKMVESLLEAGLPEIIKENLSQRELIDSYLKLETNVY